MEISDELKKIAEWLRQAQKTVVLTGAGISTESGIPDFRGPDGVWTKNPAAEKTATLQHFIANRDARVTSWRNRVNGTAFQGARPNAGHIALAELEKRGKLHLLVTQNIDGLHLDAGTSAGRLVEIHGTTREYMCLGCDARGPIELVVQRVRDGEEDPRCECGGILKSATISFGQSLVARDLARAQAEAGSCDLFLAVGTSLVVYPVAVLPELAVRAGAKLVILNAQETPFDGLADAVLRERIGTVLPAMVAAV